MVTTRRMNDGRLQVRVPADLQLAATVVHGSAGRTH
jgi:hypothetical protein